MASSNPGPIRTGSTGRGFASVDPERQREVPGNAIRTLNGWSSSRAGKASRADWGRAQPEREASVFEGSSSRRSR